MTQVEIIRWITNHIAIKQGSSVEQIDLYQPLTEYGFDSLEIINLSGEFEELLGQRIEPTVLWDYPTIWEISEYLAQLSSNEIELPENEDELDALLMRLLN